MYTALFIADSMLSSTSLVGSSYFCSSNCCIRIILRKRFFSNSFTRILGSNLKLPSKILLVRSALSRQKSTICCCNSFLLIDAFLYLT